MSLACHKVKYLLYGQRNQLNMFVTGIRCLSAELTDFRERRITHFKKNLIDLAELELKHARVGSQLCHLLVAAFNICNFKLSLSPLIFLI